MRLGNLEILMRFGDFCHGWVIYQGEVENVDKDLMRFGDFW